MRILITNDDGIEAVGIRLLVEWAKKLGEVTVVAPKVEQSGKSQGIDLLNPVQVKKSDIFDGVRAFAVDSTPADCIRFGVLALEEEFDIVFSGINRGMNIGRDIVYSGTVGAIYEAVSVSHKAIAFSTFPDTLEAAATHLDSVYSFIVDNGLLDINPIYNVNIPATVKDIKITRQGKSCYRDKFHPIENDMYAQTGYYFCDDDDTDMSLDTIAVNNDLVSITPMQIDRTNKEVFDLLKKRFS